MQALLVVVLGWFARYLAVRLLLAFGIFTISTTLMHSFFDALQNAVNTQAGSLSGVFATGLQVSGLLDAINIVFSAYLVAITIKGLKSFKPSAS